MWECKWDEFCKTDGEVSSQVNSYSLSVALNPRDALYVSHCETFSLHEQTRDRSVIKCKVLPPRRLRIHPCPVTLTAS